MDAWYRKREATEGVVNHVRSPNLGGAKFWCKCIEERIDVDRGVCKLKSGGGFFCLWDLCEALGKVSEQCDGI